jgi:integrase
MTRLPQSRIIDEYALSDYTGLTFNFTMALPGRCSSPHTQRAYYRWIDRYLVDVGGLKPMTGDARVARMTMLPLDLLHESLSAPQLRAWLGILAGRGHGKKGLDQARAAVVTLAGLLAEAQWLDDYTAASMARIRPPRAEEGQRPGRWLAVDQLKMLMVASRHIATSENQEMRNRVLSTILCTMALRREELSVAKWSDLSIQNNRVVLRVHGKGRKVATVDVPRPVIKALDRWRTHVAPGQPRPDPESPLVRRIWKGGRIARNGLSPDGIWHVIDHSARYATLGHVAPHDLRRSVAGALHEAGTPLDKISRLLRHSSIAITERYLQRLPHENDGALVMSGILGLEEEDADWPGFD